MTNETNEKQGRRRALPLLWISGFIAASLLVLGVNGTLSAWTSAIINNSTNTTEAAQSVALSEANGAGTVCVDTATVADGSNTATCSTINKYGGTVADGSTALVPGAAGNATTVTLKNTGSSAGDLTVTASGCTKSAGSGTATLDLCDYVDVLVECPAATTTYSGKLSAFATAGAVAVKNLAAGASVACTFTVSLPSDAPADIAGQIASQPLTWTLTQS